MKEWFIALEPLVGVALGALLAFLFTSRAKRDEAILSFKEEKYTKMLIKLQGFLEGTISTQMKKEFFEEQYQSWLYASDEVVETINEMIRLVEKSQGSAPASEKGQKAIGDIVLAMRRDLLRKTNLDHAAFRYMNVHEDEKR